MPTLAVQFLVLAALAGFFLWVLWPRPAFVVELKDSQARLRRGNVDPGFLEACRFIARDNGLKRGQVRGWRRAHGYGLTFRGVPTEYHQRFRNALAVSAR